MLRMRVRPVVSVAVAAVTLFVIAGVLWERSTGTGSRARFVPLGAAAATTTTRENLERLIEEMEARVQRRPLDRDAAVLLADTLLRQARIAERPALIERAVQVIEPQVAAEPSDYEARRMLATAYASAHRFREAIREAGRASVQQPNDPWNYGIIGDAHLELGERDQAFAAFQRMLDLKPTAAGYSRVSYARELRNELPDAIAAMELAVDAANPRDPESIAWFRAHLAGLYLKTGALPKARLQLAWAERTFPGHPTVHAGIARLKEIEGRAR